jgi:hypothetical protein
MPRRATLFVVLLTMFLPLFAAAADLDWPAASHLNKPWTRWWWLGSILDEKQVSAEMEKYRDAGLGGLEITPIYGVKGEEAKFLNYLSPEWMKQFQHVLNEARRLDLGIDMATGNGWPFGGPWVDPQDACRYVSFKTYSVAGGQSLDEPVKMTDPPMARTIGRRVTIDQLKDPIGSNADLQAIAPDQIRFPRPLPLLALMAYGDNAQVIDLTSKVSADGKLDWTAPAGQWTLHAAFLGWHGKQVERAGPGGEGDVIDHFNAGALNRYLKKFDDAFAAADLSGLRGFFNDSYEVDDAQGESNWTKGFFDEFQKRRGYDLRQHLPALLGNTDDTPRVICDYRETISDLLLEEFTMTWQKWAASKGKIIRNQAHGSPANILDLYAASDIPEQEGADVLRFKFASSAAHVTGKPLASAEAATWLNEHFSATLEEVKAAVDRFLLGGINHICYHGTAYSPASEPWPGFLFYAAVEFEPTNPFWNDFGALNAYVQRAQSFLQSGTAGNDVLVYYPIHDLWSQPAQNGALLQHYAGPTGAAQTAGRALLDAGVMFDYISDRQLAQTKFTDGGIRTSGGLVYRTIVIPPAQRMPLASLEKLVQLSKAGANVVLQGGLPKDIPGYGDLQNRQARFNQLLADAANIPTGESLDLIRCDREPSMSSGQGLKLERRFIDGGRIYFIQNPDATAFSGFVSLGTTASAAAIFDPMTGKSGIATTRGGDAGRTSVYLQISPGDSVIVKTADRALEGAKWTYYRERGDGNSLIGGWSAKAVAGGPTLIPDQADAALGSWTNWPGEESKAFSGTVIYTHALPRPQGSGPWKLSLGRVTESARVAINGRPIAALIKPPYELIITGDMLQDQNTLEIAVTNLAANRIADMDRRGVVWKRFYNTNMPARLAENRGPDGQFTAANWQPRESGLIGPIMLSPLEPLTP